MSLFAEALGPDWDALPHSLKTFHAGPATHFSGEAVVNGGATALARAFARFFGFPPPGARVPVSIHVERTEKGERWHRDFGGHAMSTLLTAAGPSAVAERVGPARFTLSLTPENGGLSVGVAAGWIAGFPLPRALLPVSRSCESEASGRFTFDIDVHLPLIGRMVRYRGWLEPCETASG
ncbi:MAG: DUF4166 domain-containing protein [Pseudomonadota bacterium]